MTIELEQMTPRQQQAVSKIKKLWNLTGTGTGTISIETNRKINAILDALTAEDADTVARYVFGR